METKGFYGSSALYCRKEGEAVLKGLCLGWITNSLNVVLALLGAESLITRKLTSYMTQFDACLVSYNTSSRLPFRFKTSLPYRFLIALAAGIPIILPSGKFEAMESFIKREGIGFAYRNAEELLRFINSAHKWIQLQENCCLKRNRFLLDTQELLHFINTVLNKSGVEKA